jgi:glutamate synthase domain-containing protein 3
MSQPESASTEPLDLRRFGVGATNAVLRGVTDESAETSIVGAAGQAGLATAIRAPIKVTVSGNAGAWLGMLNAAGDLEISGDAGAGCGHSMTGGAILVRGHAGSALGAFARGGFIGVHGTAKDNCGLGLSGADIVVRQSVGPRAAHAMRSGNLVLGSDAGVELGLDCVGGTIYLRGEAASIAPTLREVRMRESDAVRLGLLLVRAGIKAATKDFRIYRPRSRAEE